jgi:hypothetical protein
MVLGDISHAMVVVDNHMLHTVVELVGLLTLGDQLLQVGQMVETSHITMRDMLHGVQVDLEDTSAASEDQMVELVVSQ